DMLAAAGYHIGYTGKGWGPGSLKGSGRTDNPAGIAYNSSPKEAGSRGVASINYTANFEDFLDKRPQGSPFCFWYGGRDPHRVYKKGIGLRQGKKLEDVQVPPFFPDTSEVRGDMLDYAVHVEWFDNHLGRMLRKLEEIGELDNTLIVVTSDNGMPFPRCKATVYDWGTYMPLAIRWGNKVKPGRVVEDMISFKDFAPTFLEAAGLEVSSQIGGRSFMNILVGGKSGRVDPTRKHVVMGIERHFPGARKNHDPYPIRAIRNYDYLYIKNYAPDRWPMGDPDGRSWPKDREFGFGDSDGGPTRTCILRNQERYSDLFKLAFGKRDAEELYDVRRDPYQMKNLAGDKNYAAVKNELSVLLEKELKRTKDPRSLGQGHFFDDVSQKY
ncbi:MAG: sulfatase family protein, partial [Planctomycetota bacterium]